MGQNQSTSATHSAESPMDGIRMFLSPLGPNVARCDGALPTPQAPTVTAMTPAPSAQPQVPPQQAAQEAPKETSKNPGTYDEAQGSAKRVFGLDTFDGFRLDLAKPMSPQFALTHSIMLGSSMVPGGSTYSFGSNLMGSNFMASGRMDWNGRLQGTVLYAFNELAKIKAQFLLGDDPSANNCEVDFDKRGSDYAATLKIGNGPILGCSYNQAITSKLSMGGAGYYVAPRDMSLVQTMAKYKGDDFTALASFSSVNGGSLTASYVQHVGKKVNLGTELVYHLGNRDTEFQLGYEFTLRQTRLMANLSGAGMLTATMEEHLAPGFAILFSGAMDHFKGEHKFGIGMSIGQ